MSRFNGISRIITYEAVCQGGCGTKFISKSKEEGSVIGSLKRKKWELVYNINSEKKEWFCSTCKVNQKEIIDNQEIECYCLQ